MAKQNEIRERAGIIVRCADAEKRVVELTNQVNNQAAVIGRLQEEIESTRRALANASQAAADQADGLAESMAQVTHECHKARAYLRCVLDAVLAVIAVRARVPSISQIDSWSRELEQRFRELQEVVAVAAEVVK